MTGIRETLNANANANANVNDNVNVNANTNANTNNYGNADLSKMDDVPVMVQVWACVFLTFRM